MTYSSEPVAAAQIPGLDECGQCGKDRCFCPPTDEEWAQVFADLDRFPKPRDSKPLAGYTKGWDK